MTQPIFLQACHGQPTSYTPIWMMRQAGRYMAEYRAIRAQHTMLEVIRTPELSAEITLQPINTFGFDAAIIFSDILPPLIGMGLELEYVKGKGPVIYNPLDSTYAIDVLATPPAEQVMGPTLEAIKLVVAELTPRNIPLIGFCGAPFTLASYAIEGGGSKVYAKTKAMMYSEPAAWKRLMTKLVTVQADYLIKQAQAGASALQLFDSWAGLALSRDDYVEYVQPYNQKLIEIVKRRVDVPLINFSTGTFPYLEEVQACGGDVMGVDWRMPLGEAWDKLGHETPIMGNLDPISLLAPWPELRHRIDQVLAQAAGRPGHIFNLGHGILPMTPLENVQRTVDYVREQTVKQASLPVA
ncbi:MAG: uroporphyrinogen decarboxylase [Chloroflexota bacterium]